MTTNITPSLQEITLPFTMLDCAYNAKTTYRPDIMLERIATVDTFKEKLFAHSPGIVAYIRRLQDSFDVLESDCLNRASLKFKQILYLLRNEEFLNIQDNIRYADLCSAPGGFSYHIQCLAHKRNVKHVRAYLLSIRGDEYDTYSEHIIASEHFIPLHMYGDITKACDVERFIACIGQPNSLDFVLADGAFTVIGYENVQEQFSKHLYISQVVLALHLLKDGGNFLCKFFGIFTKFSADLIHLLSFCFEEIALVKPAASRGANAERYFVGLKYKLEAAIQIVDYLSHIQEIMQKYVCVKFVIELENTSVSDVIFSTWFTLYLSESLRHQKNFLQMFQNDVEACLIQRIQRRNMQLFFASQTR